MEHVVFSCPDDEIEVRCSITWFLGKRYCEIRVFAGGRPTHERVILPPENLAELEQAIRMVRADFEKS